MAMVGQYLDYRQIDTPWPRQEIATRYLTADMTPVDPDGKLVENRNIPAILAQVQNPAYTHVVREVDVLTDRLLHGQERSVESVASSLVHVDWQFRQLEELTDHFLRVAPTDWHVFSDEDGRTRTLARVEIIDGDDVLPDTLDEAKNHYKRELIEDFNTAIGRYLKGAIGNVLRDIERLSQFKLGVRRSQRRNPLAQQALYLVDIEPNTITLPESD